MRQVLVYLMGDWVKTSLSCNKAFVLRFDLGKSNGKEKEKWLSG